MEAALWPHPAQPSSAISEDIRVDLHRLSPGTIRIRYRVTGRISDIVLPAPAAPLRADNLWKTTCFEAFFAPVGRDDYRELNFSPSSQWAAYDFAGYRAGMVHASMSAPPDIRVERTTDRLVVVATFGIDLPDEAYRVGLSAVIEEGAGAKSYWALCHAGEAADFHRRDCFTLELPPPSSG